MPREWGRPAVQSQSEPPPYTGHMQPTYALINDMPHPPPPTWGDTGKRGGSENPSVTFAPYMGRISCVLSPMLPPSPMLSRPKNLL